jgi:hypothetical protein
MQKVIHLFGIKLVQSLCRVNICRSTSRNLYSYSQSTGYFSTNRNSTSAGLDMDHVPTHFPHEWTKFLPYSWGSARSAVAVFAAADPQ